MFATPKWEQDVPDLDVKFEKKIKHKKLKEEIAKYKKIECSDNQSSQINYKHSNSSIDPNTLNNTSNEITKAKKQKKKRKHNDIDEKPSIQQNNVIGKLVPSMKKVKMMATSTIQNIKGQKRKISDSSVGTPGKKRKLKKKNIEINKYAIEQSINNKIDGSPYSDVKSLNVSDDTEEINILAQPEVNVAKDTRKDNHNKMQLQKKETLKQMLQQHNTKTHLVPKENNLRTRMLQKLKAAQFRYLNERLYTSTGDEAQKLFAQDPSAFQAYHFGYQHQIAKWPINPLECIIKRINKMSKNLLIADMGCGEATLSQRVPQRVRSFELVVSAPGVEACDMAHTPLSHASMDVTVYCLALMGTNLTDFLLEANRVLKMGGLMIIAEVESRFESIDTFISEVQRLGFKLSKLDNTHKMFVFFDFKKIQDPPAKKGKLPKITLKPCLYKKR